MGETDLDIDDLNALKEDWLKYDQIYADWLKKHPGKNWSQFSVARIVNGLAKGRRIKRLAGILLRMRNWWDQGRGVFEKICREAGISTSAKICEVGCGQRSGGGSLYQTAGR